MAAFQDLVDSIRAAVSSTSTCTPLTVTTLNDLLLPKTNESNTSRPITKSTLVAKGKGGRAAPAKARGKKVAVADENKDGEQLSAKERSILATEVINVTLKLLSEAIKAPPPRKKDLSREVVKASARKTLRRSMSMPQTPLQPRSLNRVSSSPDFSSRHSRSNSSASTVSSGYRSVAECARVAFACLRNLQAAKTPGVDLPPLQLENGMSVLIGKLVTIGFDDLAIKELRILKRRLDPIDSGTKKGGKAAAAPSTLDELLYFEKKGVTETELGLYITTQLQVLRLLVSSRKYRQIESAIAVLQPSHPSSPTSFLLLAVRSSSNPEKFIRQLQSLSEILLSLSPSVSTSADAIAIEPRLSVASKVAFQLQIVALHSRSLWWQLAGHKGDSTKELCDPFLRCLAAFARRTEIDRREAYRMSSEAFLKLQSRISDLSETAALRKSILKAIYKILSSLAQEAHDFDNAIEWTRKIRELLSTQTDSEVKRCFVEARLASLTLRKSSRQPQDEEQLLALLECLDRPFRGEASEIDDLLTEVSSARRAAITMLAERSPSHGKGDDLTDGMREMCESIVVLCPRLCLRYLGSQPDDESATKDIVRYEQRRQFITRPGHNAIDSVLFLLRTHQTEGDLSWDLMDSKLQDCLLLADRLDNSANEAPPDTSASPSYHVKISHLYYSQYLNTQRDCANSKDGQQLRIIRRSIDCVRTRSQQEKKTALYNTKLERIAQIYKDIGRHDELFKTLLNLQDEMVENDVLLQVTVAAATMGFQAAWEHTEQISSLGRTMRSLIKVHFKCLRPAQQTSLLRGDCPDDERATMLEKYLEILSSQSISADVAVAFRTKAFQALLSIYTWKEYPLRRIRVLIRLLSLDVDSRLEIVDDVGAELDSLRIHNMDIKNSKDVGLQGYLEYLRTLATSLLELQQDQPRIDILKQSLIVWSSIRGGYRTLEALESRVEDVPGLLVHLQLVADYMQLMGCDSTRLTVLKLIADFDQLRAGPPDGLVLSFSHLGSQWLQLGYSGKAGLALDRAQSYSHENGVSSTTLLQLHLSYSEYLLGIGNYEKSEEHLIRAKAISSAEVEHEFSPPNTLEHRTRDKQLLSTAYLIYSILALERGSSQIALSHAKQSLRLLRRAWANLEEQQRRQSSRPESPSLRVEMDKLADETSNLSMSTIKIPASEDERRRLSGSSFWPLITPLFRVMSFLSNLYAHHGVFQETLYYAEQAHKLVQEVGSDGHLAIASAYLGSVWLKAGRLDKGSELLMAAKRQGPSRDKTPDLAVLDFYLGEMHGRLGDREAELEAYVNAERTLQTLSGPDFINNIDCVDPADDLEQRMASLTIKTRTAVPRKVGARTKTVVGRKTTARAKSPVEPTSTVGDECPQLTSLKGKVLRQKARALTSMKKFADALAILNETGRYSNTQIAAVEQGLSMAKQLLLQSIEQMHGDPVYSVLQESTVSFPSADGQFKADRNSGDRVSVPRTSPTPRKVPAVKGRRDLTRLKSPAPDSFFDKLRQAQEHLIEVHSMALSAAPTSIVHSISALLNNVAILLSASGQTKGKSLAHPCYASCSVGKFLTDLKSR